MSLLTLETESNRLRLVAPQQSTVETVGSRLRHQIEYAAAGASELNAEVTRLNGDFLDCIGNAETLFRAGQPDLVVVGPVEHVVVRARALAVDGKSATDVLRPGPNSAARSVGCAGQRPSERKRIRGDQRQIPHLARLKVAAPQRAVLDQDFAGFFTDFDPGFGGTQFQARIDGCGAVRLDVDSGTGVGISSRRRSETNRSL